MCKTRFVENTDYSNNLDPGVGPHNNNNNGSDYHIAVNQFNSAAVVIGVQSLSTSIYRFRFASVSGYPHTVTAAPYITQTTRCTVAAGMPIWAGQWGFAHYNSSCNLIVEGPDTDLDYWFGMMIMQVRKTIKPGDYAFVRYDQAENTGVYWGWNNKTAQVGDDNVSSCYCKLDGYGCPHLGTCPGSPYLGDGLDMIIGGGAELADPNLPPGQKTGNWEVRHDGCKDGNGNPLGDGTYTCGGHYVIGGVVCVQ